MKRKLTIICVFLVFISVISWGQGNDFPPQRGFEGGPPQGPPPEEMPMNMFDQAPDGMPPGGGMFGDPSHNMATKPDSAVLILSEDETKKDIRNAIISTDSSDWNIVQVNAGKLILKNSTLEKRGNTSQRNGDATSFYGTNSAIYASNEGVISLDSCSISTDARGSNALFATNGGLIIAKEATIRCNLPVSRGLHATFGGRITAYNPDIITFSETSSTIATDRGGGFVNVYGGTSIARGFRSAVLYSTGEISAHRLKGSSEHGEICVVEGDNSVLMDTCEMTSGSSERAIMMLQSGSGDAQGVNAKVIVNGGKLVVSSSSAPLCEVPTLNNATLTLQDVDLDVASGILMRVDYNQQWHTKGGYGHLILSTKAKQWEYSGDVEVDQYSHGTIEIGGKVKWKGGADKAHEALSLDVTVNKGAEWVLTSDSNVGTLRNYGEVKCNGFTLSYNSLEGKKPKK